MKAVPPPLIRQIQARLTREGVVLIPGYVVDIFKPYIISLLTHKGWIYLSENPVFPDLFQQQNTKALPGGVIADLHANPHDLYQQSLRKSFPLIVLLNHHPSSDWFSPHGPLRHLNLLLYWKDRRVVRFIPLRSREEKTRRQEELQKRPDVVLLRRFPYRTLIWPISRDRVQDLYALYLVIQSMMTLEEMLKFHALYHQDRRLFANNFHLWMQRITRDPDRAHLLVHELGVPVASSKGRYRFHVPDVRRLIRWIHVIPPHQEIVIFPDPRALPFLLQRWALFRPLDTVWLSDTPPPKHEIPVQKMILHPVHSSLADPPRLQEDGLYYQSTDGTPLTSQPSTERSVHLLLRFPMQDDPLITAKVPPVPPPPDTPPLPSFVFEAYLEGERIRMFLDHSVSPEDLPDHAVLERLNAFTLPPAPPLTVGELLRGVRVVDDLVLLHRLLGTLYRKGVLFHPYIPDGSLLDPSLLQRIAHRLLQRRYPDLSPVDRALPPFALIPASPLFPEDLIPLLGHHREIHRLLSLYRSILRRFLAWMLPDASVSIDRLTVKVGDASLVLQRITKIHRPGHLSVHPQPIRDPLRSPNPLNARRLRSIEQDDFGLVLSHLFQIHPAPLSFWETPARHIFRRIG